jgi:hypothetical protein
MQPEEGDSEPKRVMAPHFDTTCNSYTEAISPAVDTDRVVLRRLFFIGPDKKSIYRSDSTKTKIIKQWWNTEPSSRVRYCSLNNTHVLWPSIYQYNVNPYATMNIISVDRMTSR